MGRVRALETRLLTRSDFNRLMEAESLEEAVRLLADTDYSQEVSELAGPQDYEEVLHKKLLHLMELLEEISPEKDVVHAFLIRFDFFNLKALLREKYSGRSTEEILVDLGTVPAERLRKGVFDQEWKDVPKEIQQAVEIVERAMEQRADPVLIDVLLDQQRSLILEEIALRHGVPFICEYLKRRMDLSNIDAFIRWRWEEEEQDAFSSFFTQGGTLDKGFFKALYEEPLDTLYQKFEITPYARIVEEGVAYLRDRGSFTYLERLCTDHLMTFLKRARTTSFGVEPLIAYVLMKDFEISALRIVLVGKANEIPYEKLRERLPVEYI